MRGLVAKSLYEVWLPTLLFGVSLFGVEALLTLVLPQVQKALTAVMAQLPFIRPLLTALLGTELGAQITAQTIQAFLWVHPVVLSLVWAHEIMLCTRMPAGEIDRGTMDILLALPVSRRQLYVCETMVWLVTGLAVLAMGLAGHRAASPAMPEAMRPDVWRAALVTVNLYCVYIAVGGIALAISALSDRRGRAIASVFALVVASFLLNFAAQFWEPVRGMAFLSVMQYYQPAETLQQGTVPFKNLAVLLAVGGAAWALGGEILARRSICTV